MSNVSLCHTAPPNHYVTYVRVIFKKLYVCTENIFRICVPGRVDKLVLPDKVMWNHLALSDGN